MRGKAYLPSNRRRQAEQDPRRERDRPLLGGVPAEGGVGMEHVTKRVAVTTMHRALVVLRFLLNNPQKTVSF